MKNFLILFLIIAAIGGFLFWQFKNQPAAPANNTQQASASGSRPNIILIYADDVDCESLFGTWPEQPIDQIRFPALKQLAENGTIFTNFHVTTPVCGPSRACLLSGQYAHRNQIRVNNQDQRNANGFSGGYTMFDREHELGIWLKAAGYYTAWVGKYLHDDFSPGEDEQQTWKDILPVGWDHFICMLGGRYRQFGHVGTHVKGFQRNNDDYRTDFEADHVCKLLENDLKETAEPFFLCWAPYAAHLSMETDDMTETRHDEMFKGDVPMGIRDMDRYLKIENQPEEMASIPQYEPDSMERWKGLHQKRLRATQALDDGLARIMKSLQVSGKLDDTLIIFTSDHGFTTGQLRHFGKRFPYDRVTKVPFVVSGPRVMKGASCNQLLANIDIAPTVIDLAGGKVPATVDGISFAELLREPQKELERNTILIENWDRVWCNGVYVDAAYCSLRLPGSIYTEWASGGREYYGTEGDPEQVDNRHPFLAKEQAESMSESLTRLRSQNCQAPPVLSREFMYPKEYEENKVFTASFEPVEFSGMVESDVGIDRVDVELYSEKINSYWDGQRWSQNHATTLAAVAQPAGHISRWTCALDTREIAFDQNERMNRRDVVVNVIATDKNGQRTRWDNAFAFKMKINDPQTWIDKPEPWVDKSKPLKLTGKAADNFRLKRVQLLIVDIDRNMYWDDKTQMWVPDRTVFNAAVEFEEDSDKPGHWCTWSYEFSGTQEGRIFLSARAYDMAGNYDASIPFHIEKPDRKK